MSWTFQTVSIPPQGDAIVKIGQGTVTITDIANNKIAGLPSQSWGLLINYKTQAWVFGYEGGGQVSLTFDPSGNLTVGGNGTVTPVKYSK